MQEHLGEQVPIQTNPTISFNVQHKHVVAKLNERLEGFEETKEITTKIYAIQNNDFLNKLNDLLSLYPTLDELREQENEKTTMENNNLQEFHLYQKDLNLRGFPFEVEGKSVEKYDDELNEQFEKLHESVEMIEELLEQFENDTKIDLVGKSKEIVERLGVVPTPISMEETLKKDYQIAMRFMQTKDFKEGMKARIITNTTPKWSHKHVDEVTDEEVDALFQPLPQDESLQLLNYTRLESASLKKAVEFIIDMDRQKHSLLDDMEEKGEGIEEEREEEETNLFVSETDIFTANVEGVKAKKEKRTEKTGTRNRREGRRTMGRRTRRRRWRT